MSLTTSCEQHLTLKNFIGTRVQNCIGQPIYLLQLEVTNCDLQSLIILTTFKNSPKSYRSSKSWSYSNFRSSPRPLNSCTSTLNDSGIPGLGMFSPFTI